MDTNKKYIDYEGLKEYHKLLKQWVLSEIEQVHGDITLEISTAINNALNKAQEEGTMNDIRSYSSSSEFPVPGVLGVQYVDESTSIEYQWIEDSSYEDGGYYTQINKTADKEDISNLF